MGKVIFISYANDAMAWSLKRIGRQASRLGVFDKVILYTPSDLPEEILSHPLMKYPRGAGYWYWKPYIIKHTLDTCDDGDIVVYADAGCTLRKSFAWDVFFDLMKRYDTLAFQYAKECYPEWEKWGSSSAKMKVWTKKQTLQFLDFYTQSIEYQNDNLILGGLLFVKNQHNKLLSNWFHLMQEYPEMVMEPNENELADQYSFYVGHRHDQSILTSLALQDSSTFILPESLERYTPDAPVWASRIRASSFFEGVRKLAPIYLRIIIGNDRVDRMKRLLIHRK